MTTIDQHMNVHDSMGRFAGRAYQEPPAGLNTLSAPDPHAHPDAEAVFVDELAHVASPDPVRGQQWWVESGEEDQIVNCAFSALVQTGRIRAHAVIPPTEDIVRCLRHDTAVLHSDSQRVGYWFAPDQVLDTVQQIVEQTPADTPRSSIDGRGATHTRFTDNLGRAVHEIRACSGALDCTTGPARTRTAPDGTRTQEWYMEGRALDSGSGPLVRVNDDLAEDGIWEGLPQERRNDLATLLPRGMRLDDKGVLWAPEQVADLALLIELDQMAKG